MIVISFHFMYLKGNFSLINCTLDKEKGSAQKAKAKRREQRWDENEMHIFEWNGNAMSRGKLRIRPPSRAPPPTHLIPTLIQWTPLNVTTSGMILFGPNKRLVLFSKKSKFASKYGHIKRRPLYLESSSKSCSAFTVNVSYNVIVIHSRQQKLTVWLCLVSKSTKYKIIRYISAH